MNDTTVIATQKMGKKTSKVSLFFPVGCPHSDDHDHARCVDTLKQIRGSLLTTWMPVTEAMHLLQFSPRAQSALLEIVERGVLRILPIGAQNLPDIRALMNKYADLPMDFADATLIHVANREKIQRIFTLDYRDFSVYRLVRGKPLLIIPDNG